LANIRLWDYKSKEKKELERLNAASRFWLWFIIKYAAFVEGWGYIHIFVSIAPFEQLTLLHGPR
jgi:hypothetical protein